MHPYEGIFITSPHNQRIKDAIHLQERRNRDKSNCFLIEGYRELLRATDQQWKIEQLFVCKDFFLGENEESLISRLAKRNTEILHCSDPVFRKLSYRDRPDGLIGVAIQRHDTLSELQLSNQPFFVVAESIEKPGNLGTILRSADAAGVDALIVCDRCTDIYNPNVVRSSVGTLFTVPFVEASSAETIQWLKELRIAIVAATPSAKVNFTDVDFTVPLAIVMGTEQFGLSEQWMQHADLKVKIPMYGVADSLNVAMATTLLLYEVLRQR